MCVAGGMHGGGAGRGACVAGGAWQGGGACVVGDTATAADGTHPTGMDSSLVQKLTLC